MRLPTWLFAQDWADSKPAALYFIEEAADNTDVPPR